MDTKSVYPISHAEILKGLEDQLQNIRSAKDQAVTSTTARAIAVTATELEKVIAYFRVYVAEPSSTMREVTGG